MVGKLEAVIEELREEEGRLGKLVDELEVQRREAAREHRRIQEALKALGVRGKARKDGQGKPAPTRADVVAAVETILTDREVCHVEVLQDEVEKLIVEQGKSRSGLKLRFKEALGDPLFVEGDEGYSLAAAGTGGGKRSAK